MLDCTVLPDFHIHRIVQDLPLGRCAGRTGATDFAEVLGYDRMDLSENAQKAKIMLATLQLQKRVNRLPFSSSCSPCHNMLQECHMQYLVPAKMAINRRKWQNVCSAASIVGGHYLEY